MRTKTAILSIANLKNEDLPVCAKRFKFSPASKRSILAWSAASRCSNSIRANPISMIFYARR
jgi:hypothetical protein